MIKYLIPILLFTIGALGQGPDIEWTRSLGGSSNEQAFCIKATSDGGSIMLGPTSSDNGDITDPPGYIDFWIVKLNAAGVIEWQKTLGSMNTDQAYSIVQTTDGGYVFTGSVGNTNGDVTPSSYGSQIWVVKLNPSGNIQWQKTLGGTYQEYGYCIRQTADGGYVIAGSSNSTDGGVTGNHGFFDAWIIKLNSVGVVQWQKSYGGTGFDEAYSIRQTADGGYIVAAYTDSTNGNVTNNHGGYDIWILRLNSFGNLIWQKTIGGGANERPNEIIIASDGNFIIAGMTSSTDGDSTGTHGSTDAWIIKINTVGAIQWQETFGGYGGETAWGIVQTATGFAIAGYTNSYNTGDITGPHVNGDGWVFEINATGVIQWQKYVGSDSIDTFKSIDIAGDGGLLLAGSTMSQLIEGVAGHGGEDFLVVKTSKPLSTPDYIGGQGVSVYPNPFENILFFSSWNVTEVAVFDSSGQLVRTASVVGNSIDLDDLPKGFYTVKTIADDEVSVIKVIKK